MKLTPDELALLLLDDVSSFDEFFSFFYKEKKKNLNYFIQKYGVIMMYNLTHSFSISHYQ